MGVKRLQSVGFISDSSPGAAFAPLIDTGDVFEKPALIVYQGDHESMDGIVPVTEYHIDLLIARHNSHISKIKQLVGSDEIPIRHYPPLQVDHSTSSHDTVGRIVGELSKGTHQLVDGRIVPAVYGRVRVLGRENTEKARDGRWAEVSVGADFDEGILSELSFTPFPAATDASLLSKFAQGETMITKLQAYLMKTAKLSEKDAEDKLSKMSLNEKAKLSGAMEEEDKKEKLSNAEDLPEAKLKAFLAATEKLSDDDVVKKLASMSADEKKELGARCSAADKLAAEEVEKKRLAEKEDEDKKKLAAEEAEKERLSNAADLPEAKLKRLQAKNPAMHKLVGDFRSAAAATGVSLRKASILLAGKAYCVYTV